jgi:hypothetical protein
MTYVPIKGPGKGQSSSPKERRENAPRVKSFTRGLGGGEDGRDGMMRLRGGGSETYVSKDVYPLR